MNDTIEPLSRGRASLLLAGILLVATLVRLIGAAPQGLHVDEASNAWNAWCVLNEGVDEHGTPWPIFYTGSYGDNRSALFLYFLLPFQGMFGLTPYTTRLPAAFAGVVAVGLIYCVGRRLFASRAVGLAAAFLLAVTPWQVFSSRWGHESSISPLLVLGSLAAVLWAGAPLVPGAVRGTTTRAFIAGAACGLACYGYAAVRVFLPVFLLFVVAVTWRKWVETLRDKDGRQWFGAMALGFAITFGPLVFKHATDPAINARARLTWAWSPDDSTVTRVAKVAGRYLPHFDPRFLFVSNGDDPTQALPPGFGVLHWYALPLLLIGLALLVRHARTSPAARVALVAVLAYPAGDLLSGHPGGPNTLRSLPGLPWLELVAGVGLVATVGVVRDRWRTMAVGAVVIAGLVGVTVFLLRLQNDFATNRARWGVRTMDLAAACEWLKPRQAEYDVIFWTQKDTSFVYAPVMCYLDESPARWFKMLKERSPSIGERFHGADIVWTAGKMRFLFTTQYIEPAIAEARAEVRRPVRTLYIVRPDESPLGETSKPVHTVIGPDEKVALEMYEVTY